jgi:hypothetical protein
MKNLLFATMALATISLTSCKKTETVEAEAPVVTETVDTTVVLVDSTKEVEVKATEAVEVKAEVKAVEVK